MIPNCSPNQIYARSRTTASRKVGLETGRLDRKTGRLDWIFNLSVSLPQFPHTVPASSQDLVMAEGHRYTLVAQLGMDIWYRVPKSWVITSFPPASNRLSQIVDLLPLPSHNHHDQVL
ncbi:hypothetical protein HanPSC8_Chr05g0216511 [Helianthus annuus]|nr:hypothetical protein HanPSC8_Chr05g0216511 [Helianthus annuus]